MEWTDRCVRIVGLALVCIVATCASPGLARGDDTGGDVEQRVADLERELAELKALLRQRDGAVPTSRPVPPPPRVVRATDPCPTPPPCPPPPCSPRNFAPPCPAPIPEPCDPCVCPPPLGPCDPGLTAGYDRKFYVRDRTGRFKAMAGMYTQFRFTWNQRETPPDDERASTTDFEMVRTRIFAEAEYTPCFYVHFRGNVSGDGDVELIVSYLRWKPRKDVNVQFGRQFIALSREDWMFPQDLQTMDFSANDAVFAIGTSNAIQGYKQWSHDRLWLGVSDGAFGGGQSFGSPTKPEWTVHARYEHQLGTDDWSIWDDLVGRRGRPRGLLIGVAGAYQESGPDAPSRKGWLVTGDVSLNWDGGQALVYGTYRQYDSRADGEWIEDWGLFAQAGHFVTCNLQPYARYEMVAPGTTPGDLDTYHSALVGLNWYPFLWTNRYKISAELGYLFDPINKTTVPSGTSVGFLPTDEGDQFYLRCQFQFGF